MDTEKEECDRLSTLVDDITETSTQCKPLLELEFIKGEVKG
jgi:hypothetical protein